MYNEVWYVCENFKVPIERVLKRNHHFQHCKVVCRFDFFSQTSGIAKLNGLNFFSKLSKMKNHLNVIVIYRSILAHYSLGILFFC